MKKQKSGVFSAKGDPDLHAGKKIIVRDSADILADTARDEESYLKGRGWQSQEAAHPEIKRVWRKRVRHAQGDAMRSRYGQKGPAYKWEVEMDQEEELAAEIHDYCEKALLARDAGDLGKLSHFAFLAGRFLGIAHTGWRDRTRRSKGWGRDGKTTPERIRDAKATWEKKGGRGRFDAQALMKIDPYFKTGYTAGSLASLISRTVGKRRN
jgi:hypothetical protein